MLGIYISGHPLEEDEAQWKKTITRVTTDFLRDEDSGETRVRDNEHAVIGGLIEGKTIKYTKNNQAMAFLTIEDLYGTVEVIVFPRDFERYMMLLDEDAKIFVAGRVTLEEEKNGKLICEKIVSFDGAGTELWIRFGDKEAYESEKQQLYELLDGSDGRDEVVIYLTKEKAMKRLGRNRTVDAQGGILPLLKQRYGDSNVTLRAKPVDMGQRRG
jgi:DNA polymerase-3 subunit alpha